MLGDAQKVFNPYNSKKSYSSAQNGCMGAPGGSSVLATITSSSDQSAAQSVAQQYANGNECFWIGMRRVNGQFTWDDGTTSDYQNWSPTENKNNACVCLSIAENYKWVTRDCEQTYPYICNRLESGKVWTAQNAIQDEFLQVDLGQIMKVSGVMTQGNPQADEWVSEYKVMFSDKDRSDWHIYMNHEGSDAAFFSGNTNRYTIAEGLFRQPITARFIRVVPTKWAKKISMRIDIVGCKSGDRTDCLDDGNEFAQAGNEFTIDCPADCDKVEPQQVWGTSKYALESSVCQAAIHDGRIASHSGGSVTFKLNAKVPSAGFVGSEQHAIFSEDLALDEDHNQAMIFESDHIGCEAGWKGFRNTCFRIPADHGSTVTWSEAKTICEDQGGWLATIPDLQTKSYLYALIRDNNNLNHIWIGLTDQGHPNYYEKWSNPDATPVTYLNWERNKPSMKTRDPFNCVLVYRASFFYKNDDCSRRTNYMCERPKRPTNHIDTEDEGCKAGWTAYGDRCYLFRADPRIFVQAKIACQDMGAGISMATVYDNGINNWLIGKTAEWIHLSDTHQLWIGIYGDVDYQGGVQTLDYKWTSGEPILYTNWADNNPDITLKCVFPFYMTVLGKKQTFNDCTDKGNPGRILGAFTGNSFWCSADEDFDEHKRFVPCGDDAFYQGCGMIDKTHGTWVTNYGDRAAIHPDDDDQG